MIDERRAEQGLSRQVPRRAERGARADVIKGACRLHAVRAILICKKMQKEEQEKTRSGDDDHTRLCTCKLQREVWRRWGVALFTSSCQDCPREGCDFRFVFCVQSEWSNGVCRVRSARARCCHLPQPCAPAPC